MPLPIFAQIAIQLGVGVALSYMSSLRRKGLSRQGLLKSEAKPDFSVKADIGPDPYLWGRNRRFSPQLVYAQSIEEIVSIPNTSPPRSGYRKILLLGFIVSRGKCNRLRGVWVDGTYGNLDDRRPTDNDNGFKASIPFGGEVREYFLADGTQGDALRRMSDAGIAQDKQLVDVFEGIDNRFTDQDKLDGYSWVFISFTAEPRNTVDPETGEIDITPETELSRFPNVELDVEGRHVSIPAPGPVDSWDVRYTEETSAVIYDILKVANTGDDVDLDELRRSHAIGNTSITVELGSEDEPDPGDTDPQPTTARFWIVSDDKPPTPTTYNPRDTTPGWLDTVPIQQDSPVWVTVRTGTTADFQYSEPVQWIYPGRRPDGASAQANEGFTSEEPPYGVDPNIGSPEISTDPVYIVIPAGSSAVPPSDEPDYIQRFREAERVSIRYPCNVIMYSDEFDAQSLFGVVTRLSFNMQGRVFHNAGITTIQAGYAKTALATITDGNEGVFTDFNAAGNVNEQWNTYAISLPYSLVDGALVEIVDLQDAARIERTGFKIPLRLGEQPYLNRLLHARRMTLLSAVRRRYQRRGTFTFQPDADLVWIERLKPGERLNVKSSALQLESYHYNDVRDLVKDDYTTFRILGVSENTDKSISCTLEEDPDIVWRDYVALPNLDPDTSELGISVSAPRNFRLDEVFRAQPTAPVLYLRAAWTAAAEPTAELQWRPVVASGETLTVNTPAGPANITKTPAWSAIRYVGNVTVQVRNPYIDFGEGTIYYDVQHEVRMRFISAAGVPSAWAYATITPTGNTASPDRPRGLGLREYLDDSGFEVSWAPPEEEDYRRTTVKISTDATNETAYTDTDLIERHVTSNRYIHIYINPQTVPKAHKIFIAHENDSGNLSTIEELTFTPVGYGRDRFLDWAFATVQQGEEPEHLTTERSEAELAASGWDSFPSEPPTGMVVFSSHSVLYKDLGDTFVTEEFGSWSLPRPYAVPQGQSITWQGETFDTNTDIEGEYLDRIGGTRTGLPWNGALLSRNNFKNGLSSARPIIAIRHRRKKSDELFRDWNDGAFVNRWVRFGILTPDGAVLGHKANLYNETVQPAVPVTPPQTADAYAITTTGFPPDIPTTFAPATPWILSPTTPAPAPTTQLQYVWHCVRTWTSSTQFSWSSVSLVGTVQPIEEEETTTETVYLVTDSTADVAPPNNTPVGTIPTGFSATPSIIPSLRYEYRFERIIRDGVADDWGARQLYARRFEITVYRRGNTYVRAVAETIPGGNRLTRPGLPIGWSTSLTGTRPTPTEHFQWQAEVAGNLNSARSDSPREAIAEQDTGTTFYKRNIGTPAKPVLWDPGILDWVTEELTPTETDDVFRCTRTGWATTSFTDAGQPIATTPIVDAWGDVELHSSVRPPPPMETQVVYVAFTEEDVGLPTLPTNTNSNADLTSPAGGNTNWNPDIRVAAAAISPAMPVIYRIARSRVSTNPTVWGDWGVGATNGIRALYRQERRYTYGTHPTKVTTRKALAPVRLDVPWTTPALGGERIRSTLLDGTDLIIHTALWRANSTSSTLWRTGQSRLVRVGEGLGTYPAQTAWSTWAEPTTGGGGSIILPPPPPPV